MATKPRLAPPSVMASLVLAALLFALSPSTVESQAAVSSAGPGSAMSLQDLEGLALERNPTLRQAAAGIRATKARQLQVGTYPNPLIGYELEEFTARDPGEHKNFFWFQVPIVTAGKLQRSRELAGTETRLAETGAEAQRLRVLTSVRMLYHEALGAARLVELRRAQFRLIGEAVEVSGELYNVGQADRPDVLEIEIQRERARMDLARADAQQRRIWSLLAAAVGTPEMPLQPLAGDLEATPPAIDREEIIARVLRESPEILRAQAAQDRAQASLRRVEAERIPNLFVRTKVGYNSESYSPGKDVGFEAGIEIGVPLPLFDRQQGNIAAAQADLEHAQQEMQRVQLELRSQLAGALATLDEAEGEVERFRSEILPRARESHELYLKGFRQMAAAYPQVLIAQRQLSEAQIEYTRALVGLHRTRALLQGLLLGGGLEPPSHSLVTLPPATGHVPASSGRAAD